MVVITGRQAAANFKGEGSKELSAAACRFRGGAVKLAATDGSEPLSIRMLARSSKPIEHWAWGRVVHDMAGMKLHKTRIAIDYEHDEPIGYLDKFEVTAEGLVVSGVLVPTDDPADPARRMIARHRGGVPYEASINFGGDGIAYEYIDDGQSTQVNGYKFEGPGIVIREWPLRGVAVCPYGADMHTESQFSAGDHATVKVAPVAKSKATGFAASIRVVGGDPATPSQSDTFNVFAKSTTDRSSGAVMPAAIKNEDDVEEARAFRNEHRVRQRRPNAKGFSAGIRIGSGVFNAFAGKHEQRS